MGRGRKSRPLRPVWDAARRKLLYRGILVKRFWQAAFCQEFLLTAFQEQRWAERIDDPLPHTPGINPKKRLRNTVKQLNRCQAHPLIHFFCCNNGQGVGWVPAGEAPP